MAKVKKETVEAAILAFINKINTTMPNSMYKFIIGGATGLMSIGNIQKLYDALNFVSDENGFVDTNKLRVLYESAFKASNNKLQIELFNKPNSILSMFVKPLTLTITKDDIDRIMVDIEANAVNEEIQINENQ